MNPWYLAAALPLAWGALFLWALRRPGARAVVDMRRVLISFTIDMTALTVAIAEVTVAIERMSRAIKSLRPKLEKHD